MIDYNTQTQLDKDTRARMRQLTSYESEISEGVLSLMFLLIFIMGLAIGAAFGSLIGG